MSGDESEKMEFPLFVVFLDVKNEDEAWW